MSEEDLDIHAIYGRDAERRTRDEEESRLRRQAGRALYSDPEGAIVLRSFVVYLDELGTKERSKRINNRVLRLRRDELDDVFVEQSIRAHLDQDAEGAYNRNLPYRRVIRFSDNIAIAMPVDIDDPGLLMSLLADAAQYQLTLSLRGRYVRGGVTVGPLYADDSTIMGGALVEVVGYEEGCAKVPRVLVSPSSMRYFRSWLRWKGMSRYVEPPSSRPFLVLKDEDGRDFVNYLGLLVNSHDEGYVKQVLKEHRKCVLAQLKAFEGSPDIRPKYDWVAEYHNFVCNDAQRADLMIESHGIRCLSWPRGLNTLLSNQHKLMMQSLTGGAGSLRRTRQIAPTKELSQRRRITPLRGRTE